MKYLLLSRADRTTLLDRRGAMPDDVERVFAGLSDDAAHRAAIAACVHTR